MKEICLCIKIHTPAILSNYRFLNIGQHHNYFDDVKQKERILKLYNGNIVPFFEIVKDLAIQTDNKFKVGISISGITLSLFKRFMPGLIDLLNELKAKNVIEFLSETWSNSYIAFGSTRIMIRQIALHNTIMKSLFGVIPEVFIAHVPVESRDIFTTIFGCGKKNILLYSNHIEESKKVKDDFYMYMRLNNYHESFINYKASQLVQEIGNNLYLKQVRNTASYQTQRILKILSGFSPQIVVYNLTESNFPFQTCNSILWNRIISRLLDNPEVEFVFPSETKTNCNAIFEQKDISSTMLNQCKHPDIWLKNSLQKDIHSRLLSVSKMIYLTETESQIKDWDVLNDMEFIKYMDTRFTEQNFTKKYFSPYASPYLAYINYMNVLDDFIQRLLNQKPYEMKKHDLKHHFKNSENLSKEITLGFDTLRQS